MEPKTERRRNEKKKGVAPGIDRKPSFDGEVILEKDGARGTN
jgi:hypothetical protein